MKNRAFRFSFQHLALSLFLISALFVFVSGIHLVLADSGAPLLDPGAVQITDSEFFLGLFQSIGGVKGAVGLPLAVALTQIAMRALQAPFLGKLAGKYRLLAVYGLSMASGVLALVAAHVPLGMALLHSNTLAALQVLGHQAYKQFVEKTA